MLMLSTAVAVVVAAGVATADLSVSLPVNLTALRRRPSAPGLGGLRRLYEGAIGLLANVTVDCVPEGQPCVPDTGSCCEGLRCPAGEASCRSAADSDEEAADRLDALEQNMMGDGGASHPWAYSWEFQSRSDMEREEMVAAEEAEWKKNWKPKEGDEVESKWAKMKEKIEQKAKSAWQSVKTWKKLNELKGKIIEKYKQTYNTKKDDGTKNPDDLADKVEEAKETHEEEGFVTERSRKKIQFDSNDESQGFFANSFGHKEDEEERSSVEGSKTKPESEESVIKFSDEIPKRRKKIDFRINDIIKDGVDMIANKIKAKTKSKHGNQIEISPGTSLEKQLYEHDEIDDTEDRLMKEIDELKKLRKKGGGKEENVRKRTDDQADVDELIKRQVATILEEERKLERLRKIEELKRMEQGLANNRVNK